MKIAAHPEEKKLDRNCFEKTHRCVCVSVCERHFEDADRFFFFFFLNVDRILVYLSPPKIIFSEELKCKVIVQENFVTYYKATTFINISRQI